MFKKQTRVGDFDWGRAENLPDSKYELEDDQIDVSTLAKDILAVMPDRLFPSYSLFRETAVSGIEQVWPDYRKYIPLFQYEDFHRAVMQAMQQQADIQWP